MHDHRRASCARTKMLSLLEDNALWKCWSCYTNHHLASCAGTKLLSLLQEHAFWKLVLLHRIQCCIMRMDKHDVHATGACTLDVLVLIQGPPSCIMCTDRNAVLATTACTLEVLVLLHKPILHHVQGQSCCPCFKSMHYGTVGPATQTTMLHHVW